jgi:MFS family permease
LLSPQAEVFDNSPAIWIGIVIVLFIKVLAGVFAFPICAILITQSSPSRELLGSVNGANQALGSLSRAIGPAIAGFMYSQSLEVSKPWMVWRLGLGIFAIIVCIGAWFLTGEIVLPIVKEYLPVYTSDDSDVENNIAEEDRLWREEEDGTIDGTAPSSKHGRARTCARDIHLRTDETEDSTDDEIVQGVSTHLLSREH